MTETSHMDDFQMFGTGDLAVFLGGSHDSFTGKLLDLVAKADPENRGRLKFAFLRQVTAWELWQSCSPAPTFAQMREMMAGVESWIDQLARAPEAAWQAQARGLAAADLRDE